MLTIGNWDGGVGEKILLPASMDSPNERRALALRVVAYLRDAGFDAKFMKGGHSAWRAIGAPVKQNV